MDPFPRLIGHHVSTWGIVVELGGILLITLFFAGVWWRGKRRQDAKRPPAKMRE